jgi:H+/gluconate symporter-like permease
MKIVREMGAKFSIARELMGFLWEIRLWWAIPMVGILLLFGIFIVVGTTSGVGPFIYALF